ncbi:MAG: hypothetical protein Kow00105_18850 [Phycisphaeraceae bacterium]
MADDSSHVDNPLQGYFDWQVTTLLLAYDLNDPIPGDRPELAQQRRMKVEQEVRDFSLAVVPEKYKQDPTLDWPPEVMMAITRATFERVNEILHSDE